MTCEMAQRAIALAAISSPGEDDGDACRSQFGSGSGLALEESFDAGRSPSQAHLGHSDHLDPLDQRGAGASRLPSSASSQSPFYLAYDLDVSFSHSDGPNQPETSRSAIHREPPIPEQGALAEHLNVCRSCQAEMAATTAFFRALASETHQNGPEPSATLLARARMQLDASLDSSAQAGPWTRVTQQIVFSAGRLRAAPALSSALLLTGLIAGGYGGYRAGHAAHSAEQGALLLAPPAPEAPSVVADVSSVRRDPATGLVEVRYDRLVPDVLTAPAQDPSIRELLTAATENGVDPEVRNISVSLLSGGCAAGLPCPASGSGAMSAAALEQADAAPVRNALINALESDKTPEVRREALASLEAFIASDTQVRDAVLSALMSDPSAAVRIEAVRLLEPVDVDSSVRQVLHTVSMRDGDPSIRSASLAALRSVPQVQ